MMTPRKKAIELYNKFYNTSSHPHHVESRQQFAKQCALIAVDEIIKTHPYEWDGEDMNSTIDYWEEVKHEIEAL